MQRTRLRKGRKAERRKMNRNAAVKAKEKAVRLKRRPVNRIAADKA